MHRPCRHSAQALASLLWECRLAFSEMSPILSISYFMNSIMPFSRILRQRVNVVNEQIKALRAREQSLRKRFVALDESEARAAETLRTKTEEHSTTAGTLERAGIAMEQKERTVDELVKDLERETSERERLTNEKTELERSSTAADADLKAVADGNARARKELERTERRTGKCTAEAKHVADVVPQLETELGQLRLDVKTETRVAAERSAAIEKIRADIDKEMKAYITEESAGKEKGGEFEAAYAQVANLENIIKHLKKEEAERNRVERDVRTQVDRLIKTNALKREKCREETEKAGSLDNELDDLKKQTKEIARRQKELSSAFHEVQSQRNKFAQLIEAGKQTKSEMGEKLRVLANEIDILRSESGDKEIKMVHVHAQLTGAMTARDVLRQDINKRAVVLRESRDRIDEQANEIDGLAVVVRQGRGERIRLASRFEHETSRRDHTGLMLVERNDEVAALHERVNLQVEVGRRGEQREHGKDRASRGQQMHRKSPMLDLRERVGKRLRHRSVMTESRARGKHSVPPGRHHAAVSRHVRRRAHELGQRPELRPDSSAHLACGPKPRSLLLVLVQLPGAVDLLDLEPERQNHPQHPRLRLRVHLVHGPGWFRQALLELRRLPGEHALHFHMRQRAKHTRQVHRHIVPGGHLPRISVPVGRDIAVGPAHRDPRRDAIAHGTADRARPHQVQLRARAIRREQEGHMRQKRRAGA